MRTETTNYFSPFFSRQLRCGGGENGSRRIPSRPPPRGGAARDARSRGAGRARNAAAATLREVRFRVQI